MILFYVRRNLNDKRPRNIASDGLWKQTFRIKKNNRKENNYQNKSTFITNYNTLK